MPAPWCLFTACSSGSEWCWAGSGLIKNKLRQHSRRQDGEKDKIHASAQLTIKPNYLWIGLMGHMSGSKFPDQEVAWKGALVCVCLLISLVNVSATKRLSWKTRLGARSWLCAISSIKQTYLAFRQFDQNPEVWLWKISSRLFMAWQQRQGSVTLWHCVHVSAHLLHYSFLRSRDNI